MRKYLQIAIVLGLFFSFVVFKNLHQETEEENIQIGLKNVSNKSQNSPAPTQDSSSTTLMPTPQIKGQYNDGNYIGVSQYAYYGNIQVKAVIKDGKISDIIILDNPGDNRTSTYINSQALPLLITEAISAQSANIDKISGASYSSTGFQKSLASALDQAK